MSKKKSKMKLANGKEATIRNFIPEYLEWMKKFGFTGNGTSEDTVNRHKQEINHLLNDPIVDRYILGITYKETLEARQRISETKKDNGKPYAHATLNTRVKIYNNILKSFCLLYDIKSGFFCASMPNVNRKDLVRSEEKEEKKDPTVRDIAVLLNCMATHEAYRHFYLLVFMSYLTGARVGEMVALHWSDLDLENRRFAFKRYRTNGKIKPITNNEEETKYYTISDELYESIEAHRKIMIERGTYGDDFPMVFPARPSKKELVHGGYTSRHTVNSILKKACEDAGIMRLTSLDISRALDSFVLAKARHDLFEEISDIFFRRES